MSASNGIEFGLFHIETRNPLTGKEFSTYFKSHLRSLYSAIDIDGFFALTSIILTDYYATWRVKPEEKFIFTPLYPKFLKSDVLGKTFNYLTYRLISRNPGTNTQAGVRGKEPFLFEGGQDPNYAGYQLEDSVSLRTNLVQFDITSTSYYLAEEFTRWFELVFIPTSRAVYQAHGISHVTFKERLADTIETVYENLVYVRSLRYAVRTQAVSTKSIKTMDSLSHTYEL